MGKVVFESGWSQDGVKMGFKGVKMEVKEKIFGLGEKNIAD